MFGFWLYPMNDMKEVVLVSRISRDGSVTGAFIYELG